MMRAFPSLALALALAATLPHAAAAQPNRRKLPPPKPTVVAATKPDPKPASDKAAGGAKPMLMGTFGDWGAYQADASAGKVCYVLGKPKERLPSNLVRDPGYVFISTRPAEGVHNEISIIMGFPVKEGPIGGGADIEGTKFDLVGKGEDAWVKNAAEEAQVIDTMRKGLHLIVKAPSKRGNVTTDSYSLAGVTQALDKVAKSCP